MMLSSILGIFQTAVHTPSELEWGALPDGFIVQMHWNRTQELLELLERFRIQPIGIVRHPLDVLISILHFCKFEPQTANWLAGESGTEAKIIGRTPADRAFLDYALSDRVGALLSVSPQWASRGYPYVTYEDLVASPIATLERFLEGQQITLPIETAVHEHSIGKLRETSQNNHFWRGQPGIWRSLIPESAAKQIYARHKNSFDSFGYTISGATDLSPSAIEHTWRSLAV